MTTVNNDLRAVCNDSLEAFRKQKEDYSEIESKLEWVLGSFDFDQNPVGLHEFAVKSVEIMKEAKKEKPRAFTKKLIEKSEKVIKQYEAAIA